MFLALLLSGGDLRLWAALTLFTASTAHRYGRKALLTRAGLLLQGPLGSLPIPLRTIRRISIGRRSPLAKGRRWAWFSGDHWLPGDWSGLEIDLNDGSRLFVPAEDALSLAGRIVELRPQVQWDNLSENDYFAFLEQSRPVSWPRLTRSSIPSASALSIGCGSNPSEPPPG